MTAWTERFRELEPDWTRAPSAHNTQPWTVDYAAEEVTLGWDPARELPAGDPTRRDLFLSLGAFLETCLIVAADAGLRVRPEVSVRERQFARLLAAAEIYPTPYTRATVRARGCARGPLRHPGAVRSVPGAEGRLVELSSTQLRGAAVTADRWLFSSGPVARELRAWLRLTPRHPRYGEDGLTDRCLGLSRLEAVALRAVLALRLNRPLAPLLAASGGAVLEPEHPVLIFTGDAAEPEALVEAGRDLVRIWYGLTEEGLAVHPCSQLIDCPRTAAELRDRLGATPLAVFRVGRPVRPAPRSARRSRL